MKRDICQHKMIELSYKNKACFPKAIQILSIMKSLPIESH